MLVLVSFQQSEPEQVEYHDLTHGYYFMRPADGSELAFYIGPFGSVQDMLSSGYPPATTGDDFDPAFAIVVVDEESAPLAYA